MDLVKKILDLLIAFFGSKKATTEQENRVADDAEVAVTEKVRANENVIANQATQKAQEALKTSQEKHKQERHAAQKKTQEEQDDEQFGVDN